MLDSALEPGTSLAFISASPPLSLAGSVCGKRIHLEEHKNWTSYNSIMDSQRESQILDPLIV